jgi:hypothetical protein
MRDPHKVTVPPATQLFLSLLIVPSVGESCPLRAMATDLLPVFLL